MDPTTMMTQLVQFNELQQTMDINQTLQTALGSNTSTAGQSTQTTQPTGGI
jgi:flagellar hook assembly protein FlgD